MKWEQASPLLCRAARGERVGAKHPARAWHMGLHTSSAVFTVAFKVLGQERCSHPTVVAEFCLEAGFPWRSGQGRG